MLGRTHMAIGALGAAATAPIWIHQFPIHSTVSHVFTGNLQSFELLLASVISGAAGGLLPDMDQKDAQASRRVERIGQLATMIILLGILILFHLWTHPVAWLVGFVVYLSAIHHAEWMRKFSLLILAGGVIYLGITQHAWMVPSIFAGMWLLGATFTPHRTFTHSILGVVAMSGAIAGIATHLHLIALAGALMTGYILHLLADAVAGGVPLLWPYKRRQGIRLVKTGGWQDHALGTVSGLLVFVVVIFH